MTTPEKPKEPLETLLAHKHILLDNNVITRASDHPRPFRPFLTLLENTNCSPAIIKFVEFEFLRGAYIEEHKLRRREFLSQFNIFTLPNNYTENSMDLAINIANGYSKHNLKTPSIIDCCLAAHIVKFQGSLLLATTNHKDFPTFLFDRIGIVTIDTDKDVIPIGIYSYNIEKARSMGLK